MAVHVLFRPHKHRHIIIIINQDTRNLKIDNARSSSILMRMQPVSFPLAYSRHQLIGTLPFHHAPPLGIFRVLEKAPGYDRRARQVIDRERIIDAFTPQNAWGREMLHVKGALVSEGVVGIWLRGQPENGPAFRIERPRGGQAAWEIHWYMRPATLFFPTPPSWPGQESRDYRIGKFDGWVRDAGGRFENTRRDYYFWPISLSSFFTPRFSFLFSGKDARCNGVSLT